VSKDSTETNPRLDKGSVELLTGEGWPEPWRREWVKPRDEKPLAAQPEEVMIIAFPFALLGAAFLAFVTVAARE
jgi:hypothetical protein